MGYTLRVTETVVLIEAEAPVGWTIGGPRQVQTYEIVPGHWHQVVVSGDAACQWVDHATYLRLQSGTERRLLGRIEVDLGEARVKVLNTSNNRTTIVGYYDSESDFVERFMRIRRAQMIERLEVPS